MGIANTFAGQVKEGQQSNEVGDLVNKPDVQADSSTAKTAETAAPAQKENTAGVDDKTKTATTDTAIDFSKLSDTDFETIAARMLDPKSPFHKNEAWKRILAQREKYKSETSTLLEQLKRTNPQAAREYLLSQGRVDEAAELPTAPEQKTPNDADLEADMVLAHIAKKSGIDMDSMSPEDRQGMKLYNKMMLNYLEPFKAMWAEYQQSKEMSKEQELYSEHEKENSELGKELQDSFGLDFDAVVDDMPVKDRMDDYLKSHPKFIGGPKELFYVSHAKYLKDFGKREKEKEIAKLNEEKKRANSEQPGGVSVGVGSKAKSGRWSDFFVGAEA